MQIVIGPVVTREGGYAFDAWTPNQGLQRGYTYRRIEDAHYARKFEIGRRDAGSSDNTVACITADEFERSTTGAVCVSHSRLQEQLALNQRVRGSSPRAPTIKPYWGS